MVEEEKQFYCYMLRCKDGSLYTGYTNDLEARLKAHNEGKGAKYTRAHRPCELVYYETFTNKSEAMKREYEIKHRFSRQQKEALCQKIVKQ